MYHDKQQFATPQSPPRDPARIPQPPPIQMPTAAQITTFDGTTIMTLMQSLMAENQRLNNKSGKRPRAEKDEEDEGEPPVKLHIPEGYDDAWTKINHVARNIRPYCGDWPTRFKSLGRRAKPTKDTPDWEPLGTITVGNASIKRMHDRGAILTIKMFMPLNQGGLAATSPPPILESTAPHHSQPGEPYDKLQPNC